MTDRIDARMAVLRATFRSLGRLSPEAAARVADEIFCRPPRSEVRPHEEEFLASGRPGEVETPLGRLQTWEWGAGPLVILAHGWGSRAGRWTTLGGALIEAGYHVLTYDAPAHGRSEGRLASLPEFARALRAVADTAVQRPVALVGHSLGGAAIAVAASKGMPCPAAVLLAAPADPKGFTDRFADVVAMPDNVRTALYDRLGARLGITWEELDIPSIVTGFQCPALMFHDRGDPDIPFAEAERIAAAWPGAKLVPTEGLGHRKILHDPAVIARILHFVREHAPTT